ncbi:MAG: WYL domain-containing protein [Verrucomicrobiota bacterium]
MSSIAHLANALKVHALIDASVPGRSLTKPEIGSKLGLSEKQVTSCIKLLLKMDLPAEYDETEHRWWYEWDEASPRSLADKLAPRLRNIPDQEFAVLLMLRHGLEQLRGTPMFGSVSDFFGTMENDQFAALRSQLDDMISYRNQPVEPVDGDSFEAVAAAIYERQQIRFYYQKIGDLEEMERTVNPHHMTCTDGIWYLLAWDLDRDAMRTFAFTRIRRVRRTGKIFERLPSTEIRKSLANAFNLIGRSGTAPIVVRIRFTARVAMLIRERRWHISQELHALPDGGLELEMKVASLSEVEKWVLSWGENACVLEPPELIQRMTHRLEATLMHYK